MHKSKHKTKTLYKMIRFWGVKVKPKFYLQAKMHQKDKCKIRYKKS